MRKKPTTMSKKFVEWMKRSIPLINNLSTNAWFFQGTSRTLTQTLSSSKIDNPYEINPWVRGAIESISLNIGGCPIKWKNSRNKDAAPRDTAEWIKLFEKPGQLMGQSQLFEATLVYLLHYGECMWVLDRQEPTHIPKSIEPFNGKLFEHVVDKQGNLLYWTVETINEDGTKKVIKFETWEVCFFRLVNPYDRLRGLSPLGAAQLSIDQDTLASEYNKAFFKNSALPGGIIEVEDDMTDESFGRMQTQFVDHHQGVNKAHMLAILEGGAKYKQLVPSQKDMEFLQQKNWNRDEILACFKVPKLELGIWENVNFSIAKVQAREFWVKTLIPKMKLIEYVLWTQLFSVSGTGLIYADFDLSRIDALQSEVIEKIDMAFKLWQMGYPINQLNTRFELGLQVQPHGNAAYVMNNVFQVDATGKIVMPDIPVDPNAPTTTGGKDNAKPKPKK